MPVSGSALVIDKPNGFHYSEVAASALRKRLEESKTVTDHVAVLWTGCTRFGVVQ